MKGNGKCRDKSHRRAPHQAEGALWTSTVPRSGLCNLFLLLLLQLVVLDEVGRHKEGSCLPQSSSWIVLCLRCHCLGCWGHTGWERSWDGVRRDRGSPDSGCATSRQPTAMAAPPWLGVGLSHMATLLRRGSSVVWVHASNSGCFWGTEVPGCCFWLTCEVLCGTIKMLIGSCSGTRTEALEGL